MLTLIYRVTAYVIQLLSSRPAFIAYATKLSKDLLSRYGAALFKGVLNSHQDMATVGCILHLYLSFASLDWSCSDALLDTFDTSSKALYSLPDRRKEFSYDCATGSVSDLRACWIDFLLNWYEHCQPDTKMILIRSPLLIPRLFASFKNDDSPEIISRVCCALFSTSSHRNNLLALMTSGTIVNVTRLLHDHSSSSLKRQILDCLISAANLVVFKVTRLDDSEQSLRNKILLNLACNLNIYASMEELKFLIHLFQKCPDIPHYYLKQAHVCEQWETGMSVSIKWMTMNRFLEQLASIRFDSKSILIDVNECDFSLVWRPYLPSRTSFTRALLHEQPLVRINALQLLLAVLGRIKWCLCLIEDELDRFQLIDSAQAVAKRKALLVRHQSILEAAEDLLPDWQSVQSVLNAAIKDKLPTGKANLKTKQPIDNAPIVGMIDEASTIAAADPVETLNAQLMPKHVRLEVLKIVLPCSAAYLRLFYTSVDVADLSTPTDPLKYVSAILFDTSLAKELVPELLDFVDVFFRLNIPTTSHISSLVQFLLQQRQQHSDQVRRLLQRLLYGLGWFVDRETDLNSVVDYVLVADRDTAVKLVTEISTFDNQNDDLMNHLKSRAEYQGLSLGKGESIPAVKSKNKRIRMESLDTSSSEDDSDGDLDSSSDESVSKISTFKCQITVDTLPDPETADPSILFGQLLSGLDPRAFGALLHAFPVETAWLQGAERHLKRVSAQELMGLLYADEDQRAWSSFLWWIRLMTKVLPCIKPDDLDYSLLISSNLMGLLLVASLSSKRSEVRQRAGHVLEMIRYSLDVSRKLEDSGLILLVLNQARAVLSDCSEDRVATPISLFLAQCLFLSLKPGHFMYKQVTSLLNRRFPLKWRQFPLFDALVRLHPTSSYQVDGPRNINPKVYWQEVGWLAKLAINGNRCMEDYGLLRASRVVHTLASLLPVIIAGSVAYIKTPWLDYDGSHEALAIIRRTYQEAHRESLQAALSILNLCSSFVKADAFKDHEDFAGLQSLLMVLNEEVESNSIPVLNEIGRSLRKILE